MIKKWTLLIWLSILVIGGFSGCKNLSIGGSNCEHDYISEVISMEEGNVKFGITDANYIVDEDGDRYIDILAVIDIKDIEKESSSRDITLGYTYKSYYDEIEYEELSAEIFKPTATEDWRIWVHNNDIGHTQISIQDKLNININKVESFVVTIIENEYTLNEVKYEIEIPIEKVGMYEDFSVFNEEKFAEYYKKIDKSYSKNQAFTVEMKDFILDGYDFTGQIEIKNVSDYDLENLSVFINPIQNTGFGYYGYTDPKFDRTNGYLSLKAGESTTLDFKVNINEAMEDLYSTKKFYRSSALMEGEDVILAVGIKAMANDENLIFPDRSAGTYMYYFKDELKVKEIVRTEEEEEEFEDELNSDLRMVDYRLEKYEFEKAREILEKYLIETGKYKETVDEYVKKIDDAEEAYNNEVEGINGFSIFRPNRKLTEEEAMKLAYYRVGDRLGTNSSIIDVDGRECLSVVYTYRENGVAHITVDMNSGEVYLSDGYFGWERYMKTEAEIQIGTGYGWESVSE